jgi:hypothetical protein
MSRHKPHLDPATGSPLHPLPPSSAGTVEAALRDAFPHFQDDAPITPETIRAIGKEWHDMVVNWAPVQYKITFSDQDGTERNLEWEAFEDGYGWVIPDSETWEVRDDAQPTPDRELLTEVRTNLADNITLFSHHKAALLRLVDNALAAQPPAAPVEPYIYGGDGRSDAVETDADLPTYQDVRGILPRSSAGTAEPVAFINARLADLAEANAIYGKDQRLDAPNKVARNEREISWLKELRSIILTQPQEAAPPRQAGDEVVNFNGRMVTWAELEAAVQEHKRGPRKRVYDSYHGGWIDAGPADEGSEVSRPHHQEGGK